MITAARRRELAASIVVAVLAVAIAAEDQADSLSALQKIGATHVALALASQDVPCPTLNL